MNLVQYLDFAEVRDFFLFFIKEGLIAQREAGEIRILSRR